MLQRVARGAGLGLALFHVWLLAGQAWDGQLSEPSLMVRWLVAALLAACLIVAWRSGAPVFWGRKAVAVWLLAATLHGPALAARTGANPQGLPEASTTLLIEIVGASAALGIVLFLAAASRRTAPAPGGNRRHTLGYGSTLHPVLGTTPVFAPRPPPVR